jgi:hypothetical protein
MPFLLSSILFAVYLNKNNKDTTVSDDDNGNIGAKNVGMISTLAKNKEITLTLISGILLGLAIYTKVPAITAIPVVGFLIFANTRKWKMLGWWFVPVILIPLLWPAYALSVGQFDEWVDGVLWQATEREVDSGAGSSHTISSELRTIFYMDPLLISLSLAGILFAALRRNYFILLWVIPFFILSYVIHWVYYFHFILLLPVFCIASALLIIGVRDIFMKKNNVYKKIIPFAATSAIGLFGLTTTVLLIVNTFSLP